MFVFIIDFGVIFISVKHADCKIFPLSRSQRNIWELEQLYSNSPMNNVCTSIRIKGRIDVALVTRCLNHVLKYDSSLRTRIAVINGEAYQFQIPYEEEQFSFFNFSMTDENGFSRWENAIAQMPMPLCESPLYQFYIYKSDEKSGGILIKVHHLIIDGWSLVDLANRISSAYLALLSQEEPEIEEMPNYERHVINEKEYLVSDMFKNDRRYWSSQIEDFDGERAFLKQNGGINTSGAGERRSFQFSELINHEIVKFCKDNRVAPFTVYCAALAVYLRRMSGNERMCLGVPIVNRSELADKRTGGMYVNTLPFFFKTDIGLCVKDLIMNITERWYDLLRHHNLPFSEILSLYNQTDQTGSPLFDIVLSYQEGKIFRSSEATMLFSGKWLYSGYQREYLIIHLTSFNGENRFAVDYDYLSQIYSREDIEILHKHILKILSEILTHQQVPVNELCLMDDEELEKVLYTFNRTYNDEVGDVVQTVPEAFLNAVNKTPNTVALIYDDRKMTYKDLFERVLSISPHIRKACRNKKEKENIVAVCLPRSFDLIASMLAASFSGNAWVIIPPDIPEARISYILKDSGAAVLITDSVRAPLLPDQFNQNQSDQTANIILLDSLPETDQTDRIPVKLGGRDLAYVVYTSGSTGAPKGVMIEQASLINFSQAMETVYGKGGVLSICNIGFDVFMSESISALLRGRTIILAPDDQCNDPAALAGLIKKYAAGFTSTVPSRLEAYLSDSEFAAAIKYMERIVVGGEPLSGELVRKLEKLTRANIYNMYGPTETTIGVSYECVNRSPSLSAGKPMRNCRLYVLDEYLNPVPVGASGELYISGICVGRGYLNNDEATQKSFFNDKFETDQRMYRSGDIAYWDKYGEINIVGRRDSQIKLNGNRIEPQEIISALLSHSQVNQAAVNIIKRENQAYIAAYYTSNAEIEEDELYNMCAAFIPSYMIPRFFVRIEAIPLTANGKLDVKNLPEPAQKKQERGPLTAAQELILNIYKRILGKDDLTIDSSYFKNGGDSLNAISVISEIHRLTGTQIKVAELRTLATPANIASKIDNMPDKTDNAVSDIPGLLNKSEESRFITETENKDYSSNTISPSKREFYPLTSIQKSIFFNTLNDPAGISYNMPGCFPLPPELDVKKIEDAFRRLIAAEDILRTSFSFEGADVSAQIHDSADFAAEQISAENYDEAFKAFVRPFDMDRPPLIRMGIWQKNGQSALLMDMHHIISDGESMSVLFKKLNSFYLGEPVRNSGLSYKDFACWQQETGTRKTTEEYWRGKLSGLDGNLILLADYDRTDEFDYKGDLSIFKMDSDLSDAAERFCRERGVTSYALFAAAFGLLLSIISEKNDFVIGTPVTGRTLPETRAMIGPFIHTLPLRLRIDRGQTLDGLLHDIADDVAKLLDHADIGYEELLSFSEINRGSGHRGLYSVMFSMHPDYESSFKLDERILSMLPFKAGSAKMDLVLEAVKTERGYSFMFEYATSLFGKKTIELYNRSLIAVIEDIIKNPGIKIKEVNAVSALDRERILELSAGKIIPFTDTAIDAKADMHALSFPDGDAIFFGEERISYDTFRRRSDSIAAQLAENGVKRGDVVGVYCGRTPDLIYGLFGIMKSGAAYLPLTSQLPPERIGQMLDSAGAKIILTDRKADELDEKYRQCVISEKLYEFSPVPNRKTTDTAQVLFTSGSTGQPKGVMISHRSLANLAQNLGRMYSDGRVEKCSLCSSSILFDSFTVEVIIPLALGVSVVLADASEMMTPWMLSERMKKNGVQAMVSTPSRMKMLLEDVSFSEALPNLRFIILGGEVVADALSKRLCRLFAGHAYNGYGPAEATVFVTAWRMNASEFPSIGYPVPNARVYVLDESMRPVIPATPGEIYIGGECLSDGYIGRPDMTEAAFVPDPFTSGGKLYRTGDLARMSYDGRLEYLGRKDYQVKLYGQRIETEEITGSIMRTGLVSDAAVAAVRSDNDGTVVALRGFVVPHKTKEFDERALRDELSKKLPPYMVPSEFAVIEAIPLTVTGKTDMRALSAVKSSKQKQADLETETKTYEKITPQDINQSVGVKSSQSSKQIDANDREAVSVILKSIWKEVLAAEDIDENRSFFEQGGSSLAAMNLLVQYFKYGWKLKLGVLYEKPLLREQAEYINKEYGAIQNQYQTQIFPPQGEDKTGIVMVTGATGFLGAHIVYELINGGAEELICLVRGETARLLDTLEYYFGKAWVSENAGKIHSVSGDVCERNLGMSDTEYRTLAGKIGTVYHSAADVRHYAQENIIMRANVTGTKNVIEFCKNAGAHLGFISTLSVGGEKILPEYKARYPGLKEVDFDEDCFEIGQNWTDSVYVRSKFFAETEVQKAAETGLKAKILRVGRLAGRASDGKFQKNRESNYFYNVITGMTQLGAVPIEVYDTLLELTPVDSCAKAAVTVMRSQMPVVHLSSPHMFTAGAIIETLMRGAAAERGVNSSPVKLPVKLLDIKEYAELALSLSSNQTAQTASMLNSSLALIGSDDVKVNIVCVKTNRELERLGFIWEKPDISTILNEFF